MMKKLLYIFVYFILIKNVKGQSLSLFVESSNIWYEYGGSVDPITSTVSMQHFTYYYSNDTVLNSKVYKKMMRSHNDTTYQASNIISTQNNTELVAMFRQDSLKVYFIYPSQTSEDLYCNFDVVVGDTINYPFDVKKPVSSIDSIPFGNNYRKRYNVNGLGIFYEGIGSQMGLFHHFGLLIEGGEYLVCFKQYGITQYVYYFQGNQPPCGITNTITHVKNELNENNFIVYPNPTTGKVKLSLQHIKDMASVIIKISDVLGREVLVQDYQEELDISPFEKGIYFLTIQQSGKTLGVKKIMKE